jgi:predicted transcriptional regulator
MRRRATPAIRVLDLCARCRCAPRARMGRLVSVMLPVGGTPTLHELFECRDCRDTGAVPTSMEADALGYDATRALHAMEFTQRWGCELARVQRTARYFLGEARADAVAAESRAQREAEAAEWEAAVARGRILTERGAVDLYGARSEDEDHGHG